MIKFTLPNGDVAYTHCATGIDEVAHADKLCSNFPVGTLLEIIDSVEVLPESPEQITARLTAAIQRHLDAAAQTHRYDSIHTACGWADEFADAAVLKAWAANCWRKSTEIELDIAEGKRAIPSEAELISELPELV